MKWLDGYRISFVLLGFVAALTVGGGRAGADSSWTQTADISTPRQTLNSAVFNGKIYAKVGATSESASQVRASSETSLPLWMQDEEKRRQFQRELRAVLKPLLELPDAAQLPWDTVTVKRLESFGKLPPRWLVTGRIDAKSSFRAILLTPPGEDLFVAKASLGGYNVCVNRDYSRVRGPLYFKEKVRLDDEESIILRRAPWTWILRFVYALFGVHFLFGSAVLIAITTIIFWADGICLLFLTEKIAGAFRIEGEGFRKGVMMSLGVLAAFFASFEILPRPSGAEAFFVVYFLLWPVVTVSLIAICLPIPLFFVSLLKECSNKVRVPTPLPLDMERRTEHMQGEGLYDQNPRYPQRGEP